MNRREMLFTAAVFMAFTFLGCNKYYVKVPSGNMTDQTYPERTDQSFPDDNDQFKSVPVSKGIK